MKPTNKQSQQLSKLLQKWNNLRTRNETRSAYYAGEERFRSYGIGLPPKMAAQAKSVIGWPSKTVDMLADLTVGDRPSSRVPLCGRWVCGIACRSGCPLS